MLLTSGTIEADADGDGFGDETQDQCPAAASTQGPCPGLGHKQKCKKRKKKHRNDEAVAAKKKDCKKSGASNRSPSPPAYSSGRPGYWTCCTDQSLPSGSLKKTKRPQGKSCTSLDLDAALEQLRPGRVDVVDDQLQALDAARLHLVRAGGQRDRAGRAGRGELHEAQLLAHLVVVFGDEADLVDVEGLGPVDVGDRYLHQLQSPLDLRCRVPASVIRTPFVIRASYDSLAR